LLERRSSLLKEAYAPFGSPNAASRSKIKSGKVKLSDDSELALDEIQEFVLAASDKFGIDEVWAAVLIKSFLWNQGLPDSSARPGASGSSEDFVNELLSSFTPFYTSERLSLIRMLIPLFRAFNHPLDPLQPLAIEFLEELFPTTESKESWIRNILFTLRARRLHTPPAALMNSSPRKAAESAFQAVNEQLVLLELLFFSIWSFITPSFALLHEVWKEAMDANLGTPSAQSSRDLLRGAKEGEALQDVRTFWVVVCIETLGLEELTVGFAEVPILLSDPNNITTLRTLLSTSSSKQGGDPFYSPLHLALSLFPNLETGSDSDSPAFTVTIPRGSFTLLTHLIYTTSIFNIHLAWSRNSVLSDPGSVAARSIIKGKPRLLSFLHIDNQPTGFLMATLDRVSLERSQPEEEEGAEELRQFWEALFGFGAYLLTLRQSTIF
jgi:nuclear pore complex protein Nup188